MTAPELERQRRAHLEAAQLAVLAAHDEVSPVLANAISHLAPLINDRVLPEHLRYGVRKIALRVAEAAVLLECLPLDIQLEQQRPAPSNLDAEQSLWPALWRECIERLRDDQPLDDTDGPPPWPPR